MKESENARVQYNDMKGSAALDFHLSSTEIWDYAKEKGINTNKFQPIGLDIYYGEVDYFELSFIVIDKEKEANYKTKNCGRLPAIKISVDEKQTDFESRFKRFNIILILNRENFDDYDIVDSKDIIDFQEEAQLQ